MSKEKKFGVFAGVFTPSILTILGVIMYLRLGWVVGQGGLLMTLGIIFIAHIISVSTGLSISSIATDKKIKTGGIYYILSRSLGLPMGGAIGIALFTGTALSISLYIVGFTESFIGIKWISEFFSLTGSTNEIRFIGTIVIIVLVTLAFISTSLVIKTQFYILGAIALSLISIAIGFYTNELPETHSVILKPSVNEIPFEYLFAVFFPAVTGFTAGVAMSGDLKNPQKDILKGTLIAILVGLFIYVILAIGAAYYVDRDMLINNSNYLIEIAWISPFVVIGIWGATLSSALGGILGGPRILQAIANDNIMPKILGKGYGQNNEPRNALILIFIISELGILIGDLNMIAGVVSMFYLASYGFINLAYALESWASTDFRPSFRISGWIGIVGFFASFAVMFKLDTTAMFASLIIMAAIFLIIKRKELQSDFGDVWQSVWSSIIRTALHKIDNNKTEDRSWQPNIILFSGASEKRPHLVEFGKNLVGKFGVLSNFDLIENKSSNFLFSRQEQSLDNDNNDKGIFYRKQSCKDLYDGIEIIASTYGFSGIEPNTVLMGWASQSKNPKRFANLIMRLYELDLNIVLMDYDKRYGFGDKNSIDIWWRDEGQNNNLSLFLAKFLILNDDWANSKLRLIIVSDKSLQNEQIFKKAQCVIENLRIETEIKIINNQIDQKDFYDIIRIESKETNLVFIGIPDIEENKESEFVENTSKLLTDIGTVVMIKASSFFKNTVFFKKRENISINILSQNIDNVIVADDSIDQKYNLKQDYKEKLIEINQKIISINKEVNEKFLSDSINKYISVSKNYLNEQIKRIKEINKSKNYTQFDEVYNSANYIIDELNKISIENNNNYVKAINYFQEKTLEFIDELPDNMYIKCDIEELKIHENDSFSTKRKKNILKLFSKFNGGKVTNQIKFKKFIKNKLPLITSEAIKNFITNWDKIIFEIFVMLKEMHQSLQLCIQFNNKLVKNNCVWSNDNILKIDKINFDFIENETKVLNQLSFLYNILNKEIADNLALDFENFNLNSLIKLTKPEKLNFKQTINQLSDFTNQSLKWHKYYYNELKLEIDLIQLNIELYKLSSDVYNELEKNIDKVLVKNINILKSNISKALNFLSDTAKNGTLKFENINGFNFETIDQLINALIENSIAKIDSFLIIVEEKTEVFENNISDDGDSKILIDTKKILSKRLAEELIANSFTKMLYQISENLPEQIKEAENEILNNNRLIKYSIIKSDNAKDTEFINEADVKAFLEKKLIESESFFDEINRIKNETHQKIINNFSLTFEKLQLYNFKKEANSWNQLLPSSKNINKISKIKQYLSKVNSFIDIQINQFWYKQSDALLLANQLTNNDVNEKISLNKILDFTEKVSIKPEIEKNLPFYYKHLFLNKNYYNKDFWFGRNDELKRADKAYERFLNNFQAALLVTGEKNSGKSFFINIFCQNKPKIKHYFVNAPNDGSTDEKQFLKALQDATNIDGDYKNIFKTIKKNSIIIIEDIELWWTKSENGNTLIQEIYKLINEYSKKVFFIVSANFYSYKIIDEINPSNYLFLDTIICNPLNTKTLQDIIMFRHQSSGLKFAIKENQDKLLIQKDFKSKNFAKLFSKYFNYTDGNVGAALLSWIANIEEIKDSEIIMKSPKNINLSVFDFLEKSFLMILNQFVIHNKLNIDKLSQILLIEKSILNNKLELLIRTGIININNHNVMEINPFLNKHIVNLLKENELL
ncbi:MAG: amino acid permease [Bacteroidales bacterium]|nr:amino acid permease [Bacteroidales bacterium]MBN2756960.1 amino acid permease [Bacteroidales bacterium]